MRLIDADKLKEELKANGLGYQYYMLDNAPTVKAIPIDKPFLKMRYGDYVVYNKKWLVDHLQTEWNILQGKEYQPSIPIEWIKKKSLEFLMNRNFRWATDFQEVIDMWKVENNIPLFEDELKITREKENEID